MTSDVSQQPPSRKVAANLIIVCCHAIYHGGVDGNPHDEADWALQFFQRSAGFKQGEHLTFIRHIEAAFKAAADDNRAALVFSGGYTNRDYPDSSEARSYLDAVRALGELKTWDILLEQLATDSYQNLLFSIILFRKKYGYYPSNVKVVTHAFKAPRFRDLHAQAIHWPAARLEVIGINPPFSGKLSPDSVIRSPRYRWFKGCICQVATCMAFIAMQAGYTSRQGCWHPGFNQFLYCPTCVRHIKHPLPPWKALSGQFSATPQFTLHSIQPFFFLHITDK
jgi:hypothetical protein